MKAIFSFFLIMNCILIFSQKNWKLRFYNETIEKNVKIFADNDEEAPVSVVFDFKLDNMASNLPNGQVVVIPEKTKQVLIASLNVVNPTKKYGFQYTNSYNFGNVLQEKYDENYIYALPFEKGKTQLVYQGYNGNFSHQNAKALDFNLKIGDKVYAARDGKVIDVIDNNTSNCPKIDCVKYNNKIVIMHSDGTFADYAHLKYKGSEVKVGDLVEKGQLIGFSGNTGFSNGPHLHFAVFINRMGGERTYIPTRFKTSESEATLLEEQKKYTNN